MKSFVFLLRSGPDVDCIAPLMHACLERGDRIFALFDMPYEYGADYRIQFLKTYPNFKLLRLPFLQAHFRPLRLASRFFWSYPITKFLLKRFRIAACVFEWGEGVRVLPKNPFTYAWLKMWVDSPRNQLIRGALERGIPAICLPHGVNMKTNPIPSAHVKALVENAGSEGIFADRNSFTAYVVNTPYFRENLIKYYGLKPNVIESWGSARYSPQWVEQLARICPAVEFPPRGETKIRVLFFLPKWHNNVDRSATIELITSLARRTELQLVIKLHPRIGEAELGEDFPMDVLGAPNVHIAARSDESPSLIAASDVVIDVGSSITLEAVVRGKWFIYPAYLHTNKLIYDEVGGALKATSREEALTLVDDIVIGTRASVPEKEISELMYRTIYGGRAPHDVPQYYYERLTELAVSEVHVSSHTNDKKIDTEPSTR